MQTRGFPDHTATDSSPNSRELHAAIRQRAEEIYEKSGRIPGRDLENWVQAESEIRHELAERATRKAVVVKVAGIQCVGEYSLASEPDYAPGEFSAGEPVVIRFKGDKMYLKRHNGTELETTVVEKLPEP